MKTLSSKDEARKILRQYIRPGDTVYTVLRHVSSSGMFRVISPVVIRRGGDIRDFSRAACNLLGERYNERHEGVPMGGCGMDMGFNLVYLMSTALYPKGFTCAGPRRCCSNDHSNGDRDYSKHLHRDGGYALRQRWL